MIGRLDVNFSRELVCGGTIEHRFQFRNWISVNVGIQVEGLLVIDDDTSFLVFAFHDSCLRSPWGHGLFDDAQNFQQLSFVVYEQSI